MAQKLGHSIVEPQPSLFTFKVEDTALAELAGVCGFVTLFVSCIDLSDNGHYFPLAFFKYSQQ